MIPALPRPRDLPPRMPHGADHAFRRACRVVVRLAGWRLTGTFPDRAKLVLVAAPHSSWWDGVVGLLVKVGIGADVNFMAKRELFVGPLGWLLRRLGGIPIDRAAAKGVVEQMVERLQGRDALWLGLTPEGTRRAVPKWKSGFWHIARRAGVDVLPVYFHYPEKTIGVGPLFTLSDDMDADIARIREYFAPFRGRHRGV